MSNILRCLVFIVVAAAPAMAQLQFFALGDLPGGATNSSAFGVSANGAVVVGSASTATGTVAFSWTEAGGMVALPRLAGGTSAVAYAGQVGNNDVWKRLVGPVSSGTTIEYFVEVISAANGGLSYFDNNDNNNYSFTVP